MIPTIKVKAFALIRRGTEILLEPISEKDGIAKGYRPLGGSIEFGETASDGLKREFMEELGEEIIIGDLLCVSEEIFEYDGHPGHEAAFIYEATFVNKDLYNQERIVRIDTLHKIPIHGVWLDPFNLPDGLPLWPEDFVAELKKRK